MRIKTAYQEELFRTAIKACTGYVLLVDPKKDKEYHLENDLQINEAIQKIKTDYRENLELFANKREDTEILIGLIRQLKEDVGNKPTDGAMSASTRAYIRSIQEKIKIA